MILKLLSQKSAKCVFKGGTSLSKGFHVIKRFSEDIDITFSEHLGEARRKKLKYNVMKEISEELDMPISNWNKIESDKDYNCYIFQYEPLDTYAENSLTEGVKVETALASYSFPTERGNIDSYVRQYLELDNQNLIKEFELEPFEMNLQSISRTYIDKVFALCDYYIQGKSKRYSRHLYDLYKLKEHVVFNEEFSRLIKEVRKHRAGMMICPSAKEGVDIPALIHKFCEQDFFRQDYISITEYFVDDMVEYEQVIDEMVTLADSGMFH
ncbi:MAG: nucleotidyl transferase AbiEii/AbiGii toxin family protein [Lachnospiraceae bacterium]|nr:nucleotidyl transferase AbiEii/AbiGii toxin family protein [Lachnospiraceae bacterium]